MLGSGFKDVESIVDHFVTEGGVSLTVCKETERDPQDGRVHTVWTFPILNGYLFSAVLYEWPEEGRLVPYIDVRVALGTMPLENYERFLETILSENSQIVNPMKVAILGPDVFGVRMRARVDSILPEYWPQLLAGSILYGVNLFETLQKDFGVETFENAQKRSSH